MRAFLIQVFNSQTRKDHAKAVLGFSLHNKNAEAAIIIAIPIHKFLTGKSSNDCSTLASALEYLFVKKCCEVQDFEELLGELSSDEDGKEKAS